LAKKAEKPFTGKIHPVVKWPDPVLAKRGEEVTVFDDALKTLVDEMFESMYIAQGIGLAAPQIALSKRIAVIDVSFKKNPSDKIALINPQIIHAEGKQVEEEGEELLSRALQHEIDHLDGVLFIDRISRLKRELVLRKIKKMQKNGEW